MPHARCLIVAASLLCAAPAAAAQQDGTTRLAAMKAAAGKLSSLHAVVRAEESVDGAVRSTRFVECWVDVKRGRVRTELRRKGCASPHLVVVAGPEGLRFQQLEMDEIAEQKLPLDLARALPASLAGELLSTAFRGDLVTLKLGGYGKPKLAPKGENVGRVGCTRLQFTGNGEVDLWLGDGDQLPRRIRGPLPPAPNGPTVVVDESIVLLEPEAKLARVAFEIAVAEGRRLPEPAAVRERWSSPPPERERWPKPEAEAPDFAALDLDAHPHRLGEFSEEEVVIAFWLAEDGRSPALAAEAEKAWLAAGDGKPHFIHVAAGDDREPAALEAARHDLKAPVWVAGSFPEDAFRRWKIWSCPVFVRVAAMQVVAISDDVEEVRRWLK